MSIIEVAIWIAVSAFMVLRIAMLVAFAALPVAIIKMVRHQPHSTA